MPTQQEIDAQNALMQQALASMFGGYGQATQQAAQQANASPQQLGSDPASLQAYFQGLASEPDAQAKLAQAQQAEDQRVSSAAAQGYQRDGSLTPEMQALMAQENRYGNDMSWLDPSFQYQANQLGQSAGSQVFTDPALAAQQQSLLNQNQALGTSNLSFQDPGVQQGLANQWAQIQGGQGAPSFMGNSQQQALMQQLLGVAAPSFKGEGDQRNVLNAAMGFMSNSGPGSLQFDTSGRQGEQYGNLKDIIAGGGATAIERADRARARADSEAWLRGQREADMADYAERGLTGSGMELLNLAADRQSAAGRNSQADLDMAKALEERRLGAINSAAGLATNMRGQTIDEQGLLNSRATTGLSAASGLANSMRSADIQEQLGLNQALQSQALGAAGIAGTMRGQDTAEKSYLDQRMINALGQQTDLATTMRNQQANEQIANRNAQLNALGQAGTLANSMRTSAAQEGQYRATAADDFSRLNQAAINNANSANTNFLQNAYQQMQNNRLSWDTTNLNNNTQLALGQQQLDAAQNAAGFQQGTNLGASDATNWNNLSQDLRNQILAVFGQGQAAQAAANQAGNAAAGQIAAGGVGTAGAVGSTIASIYGGGATAGAATGASSSLPTAGSTSLSMPTGSSNPYGVSVSGGSNTGNPYGVSVLGLRRGSLTGT